MLRYRLSSIAMRSSMCWQQFTVSPASSEWLKDNVSMNFSIDTIPSSYVWSALRTLDWSSQVLESLSYYYSCQEQLSPFVVKDIWELSHVISLLQMYISQCKFPMFISSKIIIHLYSMYFHILQLLQLMNKF